MFEALNFIIKAILDLTFFGEGMATVLGFIGIFVAIVLWWSWTQYLVTEAVLDITEWRQKRKAVRAARGCS